MSVHALLKCFWGTIHILLIKLMCFLYVCVHLCWADITGECFFFFFFLFYWSMLTIPCLDQVFIRRCSHPDLNKVLILSQTVSFSFIFHFCAGHKSIQTLALSHPKTNLFFSTVICNEFGRLWEIWCGPVDRGVRSPMCCSRDSSSDLQPNHFLTQFLCPYLSLYICPFS